MNRDDRRRFGELVARVLEGTLTAEEDRELAALLEASPGRGLELSDLRAQQALLEQRFQDPGGERIVARIQSAIERRRAASPVQPRRSLAPWAAAGLLGLTTLLPFAVSNLDLLRPPRAVRHLGGAELDGKPDETVAVGLETSDGSPVAGATVRVSILDERRAPLARASGRTDESGTARVALDTSGLEPGGNYTLRIEDASWAPWGPAREETAVAIRRPYRIFLTGDRPFYRPGQSVRFRCLVLDQVVSRPVVGETVTIDVRDPKGNRILHQEIPLATGGVASGELPLSRLLTTGTYQLTSSVGNQSEARSFEVRDYQLPRFEVHLTTERSVYRPGERMVGTISARYTYGEPVAGGSYVLTAAGARRTGRLDADGRARFVLNTPARGNGPLSLLARVEDRGGRTEEALASVRLGDEPFHLAAVPEGGTLLRGVPNTLFLAACASDGTPLAGLSIEVDGLVATTDDRGLASLEVEPAEAAVGLRATSDGRTIATRIPARDTGVLIRSAAVLLEPGQPATLEVRSTTDGRHVCSIRGQQGLLHVETVDVEDGRATVAWTPPADVLAGLIEVHVASAAGVVHGSRYLHVGRSRDLAVDVRAGRETYRPGEKVQLEIRVADGSGRPTSALIGVDAVDTSVFALGAGDLGARDDYFSGSASLAGGRFALPAPHRGLDVTAAVAAGDEEAARILFARSTPERADAGGGAAALRAARSRADRFVERSVAGLATATLVCLLVLGLVLLGLGLRSIGASTQNWFTAPAGQVALRRATDASIGVAGLAAVALLLTRVDGLENFGGILLVPALGLLALTAPTVGRGLSSLDRSVRLKLYVLGAALGLEIVLIGLTSVVGEGRWPMRRSTFPPIFLGVCAMPLLAWFGSGLPRVDRNATIPFTASVVLAVACFLSNLPGTAIAVLMLVAFTVAARRWGGAEVAALCVLVIGGLLFGVRLFGTTVRTKFDGSKETVNAQLNTSADGGSPSRSVDRQPVATDEPATDAPARVRRYFPETLAWQPVVWVDESGLARLEFDGADSITTWRARALASTEDGRVGTGFGSIRVFQEFFVRMDPPLFLTRGDRVRFPVSVFNYGRSERRFELDVRPGVGLTIHAAPAGETRVDAGGIARFEVEVSADRVGRLPLAIEVRDVDGEADAVERRLTVRPDGRRVERVETARVRERYEVAFEIGDDTIPGSAELVVRAHVSPLAPTIEGIEALVREPFG